MNAIDVDECADFSTPAPDPDAGKVKNLWQKMADVYRSVGFIQKRGQVPNKYKFVENIDLYDEIREELLSRNIIPTITRRATFRQQETRATYKGDRAVISIQADLTFEFVNADNPQERISLDWTGWAEGDNNFTSSGVWKAAIRHFYLSNLLIATGEETVEEWTAQQEEKRAQERYEGNKQAERSFEGVGNRVGTAGRVPTADDLSDSDPTPKPGDRASERPIDESWRGVSLKMCEGLETSFPGKRVQDLSLKVLIKAQEFVRKVKEHFEGYRAPGHQQLASALYGRLLWEIYNGNVRAVQQLDGTFEYEVATKGL